MADMTEVKTLHKGLFDAGLIPAPEYDGLADEEIQEAFLDDVASIDEEKEDLLTSEEKVAAFNKAAEAYLRIVDEEDADGGDLESEFEGESDGEVVADPGPEEGEDAGDEEGEDAGDEEGEPEPDPEPEPPEEPKPAAKAPAGNKSKAAKGSQGKKQDKAAAQPKAAKKQDKAASKPTTRKQEPAKPAARTAGPKPGKQAAAPAKMSAADQAREEARSKGEPWFPPLSTSATHRGRPGTGILDVIRLMVARADEKSPVTKQDILNEVRKKLGKRVGKEISELSVFKTISLQVPTRLRHDLYWDVQRDPETGGYYLPKQERTKLEKQIDAA